MNSSTAMKYEDWTRYVGTYWIRKERWCKAWRDSEISGHHTNNYSEATVRIFKDLVLNRCKAYNAIALVDFTSSVLESYYTRRLREFSHSRNPTLKLLLANQVKRAGYVKSKDELKKCENDVYLVPSSKDPKLMYEVNAKLGKCTCLNGKFGRFCRHEAAVYNYYNECIQILQRN